MPSWRLTAAALLVLAAAAGADEPPRKLSPRRKELAVAVEEYHQLERKCERGGYEWREYHDLKDRRKEARHRVADLKAQIFKEEQQRCDYYQDDPYPEHFKDPETGLHYRGSLPETWEFREHERKEREEEKK